MNAVIIVPPPIIVPPQHPENLPVWAAIAIGLCYMLIIVVGVVGLGYVLYSEIQYQKKYGKKAGKNKDQK